MKNGCILALSITNPRLHLNRLYYIVFFFLLGVGVFAQPYSNKRLKRLTTISDTIKLDTLSIIPGSVLIFDKQGAAVDTSNYTIDYPRAILTTHHSFREAGYASITILYRVFPLSFAKEYFNKDKSKLISPDSLLGERPVRYNLQSLVSKPFGDNIEATGSISRGMTFGNNQDAVVTSGLNLQINGMIDNHIHIEGAISDKTIPFQPKGNTQRLEEFDRIYLRAYTSKFEVQAGDVEIRSPKNSYLRYNRNVQGLAIALYNDNFSKGDSTRIQASTSIAKGKFSRNIFTGVEGNQGPYKLTGVEGESYIIIIAGSERVYLDGALMVRGETNQYTIDYNTAELAFTPLMRITGNSRISIEFEYTERSYARFLVTSGVEQKIGKTTIRVNAFSEQDSKNQPVDQNMGEKQIDLLKGIGDRIDQAFVPQVDSVDFSVDKIMYEKRDTIVNLATYKIYRHSTNPAVSHYVLSFTYLGESKGNYIPKYSSANGSVYVWVAPVNGKPAGNYEPVKVLVTPKRKQMATIFVERRISTDDFISSEVAVSRNDINTFSAVDKGNDVGEALRINFRKRLTTDTIRGAWIFGGGAITSSNFTFVERYRPIEFERDWNISSTLNGGNEQEFTGGFGFKSKQWQITGTMEGLKVGDDYKGLRHGVSWGYKASRLSSEFIFSNLTSNDSIKTSQFNRIRIKTEVSISSMVANFNVEGEDNSQHLANSGRSMPTSFRWIQSEIGIGLPDSLPRMAGFTYKYRKDWKSPDSLLRLYSYSQDLGFKARMSKNQNSRLNLYAGYRIFNPIDTTFSKSQKRENTLLGRLDYYFVIAQGFITSNIGYEIGSGLEPKYQFYYIELPAGQGVFTWIDYNANGIKELDEFEIATFKDEAKFIRINLPSNQYTSVNNNALNVQFDIRPDNLISDTSAFSRFAKKFSNQFSYNSRQKNSFSSFPKSLNTIQTDIYDTNIVNNTSNFRNSIAFNRFSRTFGLEWINTKSISKAIQTNGYEIGRVSSDQINMWFGVPSGFSLSLNFLTDAKKQESEFFQQRRYSIRRNVPSVKFRYSGMLGFNVEIGYDYESAINKLGIEENSMNTLSAEVSYSIRSKSWINIKSNLSKIDYKGDLGTPIEYEFLRGFKPGTNATWELNYRRKISSYFEMNIGYNGRYISTGNVVHTGSMEVRAVF